jgi:hypothetical protein
VKRYLLRIALNRNKYRRLALLDTLQQLRVGTKAFIKDRELFAEFEQQL